jgi:hypothetical protein
VREFMDEWDAISRPEGVSTNGWAYDAALSGRTG